MQAQSELKAKYGASEWNRLSGHVREKLEQNPHLIPDEARTSPTLLTQRLEDVMTLVRGDVAAKDKRNLWQRIKDADDSVKPLYFGPTGR